MKNKGRSDSLKLLNGLSLIHLISRTFLIFLVWLLFKTGGYDAIEIKPIVFLLTPLSIFYYIAFIRFAIRHPYSIYRRKLSKLSVNLELLVVLVLYFLSYLILVLNPYFKDVITTRVVHISLLMFEINQAALAATRLAKLMAEQE